jgi:predicted dehydrogenase
MLTPQGKAPSFLIPIKVIGDTQLLKWGSQPWLGKLHAKHGVSYTETPAEDYATATIVFRNPETKQLVTAQINDSWMYAAPALRLSMEVIGATYSYSINTLTSPARAFISDEAAEAVTNAEKMAEKAQASRGDLAVLADEPELYGYGAEWRNARDAFLAGQDGYLNFDYGCEIAVILMAAYMSAEMGVTINLEEPGMMQRLLEYVPAIQQGKGHAVLGVSTACLSGG